MSFAAIILGAGLSTRMGRNKLLEEIAGKPLLRRVAEAVVASRAHPVLVVVGNERGPVCETLAGLDVQAVENKDYREGLAASIRAGVAAVPQSSDGVLIVPGDLPNISSRLIDAVMTGFAPKEGRAICVASHRGQRGHPVLFGRELFPELLALTGDRGAKRIVEANQAKVCEIEAGDDAPLADIDTPEALAKLRATIA